MAAAEKRIGRLKRVDRAAVFVITFGGIAVVVAVLAILVFIGAEAIPLFRSATLVPDGEVRISTALVPAQASAFRAVGTDEYLKYIFTVEPDGVVAFFRIDSGERTQAIPVPGLAAATVTSSSRSVLGQFLAAGLSDGRVALMQARFVPQYDGQLPKDLTIEVRDRGLVTLDSSARPVRDVSFVEEDGQKFVAGVVADGEINKTLWDVYTYGVGYGKTEWQPWLADAQINRDRNLRLQYMAAWAVNNYLQAIIYDEMLLYRRFPANLIVGSEQRLEVLRRVMRPPQDSDSIP